MKLYSKILERNWIFPALTSREQEEVVDKVAELSKEAETTELTDEMMTDALGHLYDPYYLRSLNSEENGEKAMDANLRKDEPDYKNSKIKTTTTLHLQILQPKCKIYNCSNAKGTGYQ